MLTQRKNKIVTRHSGYMDARNDSSAALVLVVLPCLRDMRLKMAMTFRHCTCYRERSPISDEDEDGDAEMRKELGDIYRVQQSATMLVFESGGACPDSRGITLWVCRFPRANR